MVLQLLANSCPPRGTSYRPCCVRIGGKWKGEFAMCRGPAHADGKASRSRRVGERAVLFHCFAGGTADAIMSALRTGKLLAPANHDPGQRQDSKTDLNKLALAVWRHAEPFAGTLAARHLRKGPSIVPARTDVA